MTASTTRSTARPTTGHRNEIVIVGRVTSPPEERELPSGDVVRSWRVTVDREEGSHDVIDCTAWTARLQRSVSGWAKGDVVEVAGALRRRFWRTPSGPVASRCEVEVLRAKRVSAAR
jgi:single-strand DNA-binding protein